MPEMTLEELREHLTGLLLYDVLPPALVSAVLYAVILWLEPRRPATAYIGAALAFAAGFLVGNQFRTNPFTGANPFTLDTALFPLIPGPTTRQSLTRQWLCPAAFAALVASCIARQAFVPAVVGWLLRAAAAGLAGWVLVPAELRTEMPWLPAAFATVVLAGWAVTEQLAGSSPDGSAMAALALTGIGAAFIFVQANIDSPMDGAFIVAASLAGIGAVALWRGADAGGAAGGAVVLLVGLLQTGQYETFSSVPKLSFVLVALAPLALGLTLVPPLYRRTGWLLLALRLALVLLPIAAAAYLAMQAEISEGE